jgi:hypothetical protein
LSDGETEPAQRHPERVRAAPPTRSRRRRGRAGAGGRVLVLQRRGRGRRVGTVLLPPGSQPRRARSRRPSAGGAAVRDPGLRRPRHQPRSRAAAAVRHRRPRARPRPRPRRRYHLRDATRRRASGTRCG